MEDDHGRPHLLPGKKVEQYVVQSYIGGGGYGDIYAVIDETTNQKFAMKVEFYDAEKQGLADEINFMAKFQGTILLPSLITNGVFENFRYLVMELLGPSVSNMRRALPGHKYSQYSALALSYHMLDCIEELHNRGLTHRDIKPGNFLIRPNREHPLCLIDFGLSKPYLTPEGVHIPFSDDAGFTGTCRYASLHAHDYYELSRRDDLISWFYSCIELVEGRVPWPGSKDRELTEKMKKNYTAQELCRSLPQQYMLIYKYIRKLKFDATPNYAKIKRLILVAINHLNSDHAYDWEKLSKEEVDRISTINLELNTPPNQTGFPEISESQSSSAKCQCIVC